VARLPDICPLLQGTHGVLAFISVSAVPARQSVQLVDAAAEYSPGVQAKHGVAGAESSSCLPAGQSMQNVIGKVQELPVGSNSQAPGVANWSIGASVSLCLQVAFAHEWPVVCHSHDIGSDRLALFSAVPLLSTQCASIHTKPEFITVQFWLSVIPRTVTLSAATHTLATQRTEPVLLPQAGDAPTAADAFVTLTVAFDRRVLLVDALAVLNPPAQGMQLNASTIIAEVLAVVFASRTHVRLASHVLAVNVRSHRLRLLSAGSTIILELEGLEHVPRYQA
jgi:hypothetical protein